MAALNFPNSPSLNDTHTENGVTFKWNGAAWDRLGDIGAQGAAGAAGAQGAAGAAGAQGATGPVAGSSSQVVYKDGSNNPAGSSSFTFDGTNLTVGGNVSIGGTLTYEDVTNIDSVGLITARNGLQVTGGNVGINKASPSRYLEIGGTSNNPQIRLSNGAGTSSLEVLGNAASGQEIRFGTEASPQAGRIIYQNNVNSLSYTNTGGERLRIDSSGRLKIGSISDYSNNVTNCPVYIAMQTDMTDIQDGEGGASAGLLRIEETGSNNNRYHGIDLRNTNSGDIRILNQDVGVSDRGDLIIAMPDGDASDGVHNKMRFNSIQSSIQISGKGGAVAGNTATQHTDIYIATKTGVTAVGTGAGEEVAGIIRFEDIGSNNSRYHGIELRNRNSGDVRILNLDEGTTNKSNLVFAIDNSGVEEVMRLTSTGLVGIDVASPTANLDVNGSLQLRGSGSTTYATKIYTRLDSTHCSVIESYLNSSTAFEMMGTYADSGGANPRIAIGAGGQNVGINLTDPAYDLDVNGSIRAKGTGPGAGLLLHTNTGVTASANLMQIWSSQSNGFSFHTNGTGDGSNEVMRLTGAGQLNIGGNYTQTNYRLQVDGGITGDYFVGRSLSDRTGFKWGASGIYYLTLGGSRSGNASSFTMFELTGMNNSKFVEIQISFAHAGGGSHGSYRRAVYTSNGYQGLNTLENVTSNYGGGSGFTITKPSNQIVRVVWNGCTGFQDGFQLCCQVKTSNSSTVFQNVDSAFG